MLLTTTRRGTAPPLLIIVSDEDEALASVRAGKRDLWRWQPGDLPVAEDGRRFTGDPEDPETFRWADAASDVSAVIEVGASEQARAVARAIHEVRPDAAVLMLCDGCDEMPGDGTLARSGRLRDVLRIDVDEELRWLEAQRKVHCLRRFAEDADVLPILVHSDPDPDALSSAYALRVLLRRSADAAPIVTLGTMSRPENRRMAELLHLRVTEVSLEEVRRFDRVVVVDVQPQDFEDVGPRFAVIDHHPLDHRFHADFVDVRPGLGATATMLTQYLRADDEQRISPQLATALIHGIRTDTDTLTRGVTPYDVEAYAYLQSRADRRLLLRFERPTYSLETVHAVGRALAEIQRREDVVVAYLGELDAEEAHSLAGIADFCLAIEQVNWSAACAIVEDTFMMPIRHIGNALGAGDLAAHLARDGGSGGGHQSMARVTMPARRIRELARGASDADVAEAVLSWVMSALEELRSGQSSSASPSSAGA
jgi:nanoRNase/pAp phosphatase (c-di-AMP/oligoRNAs hydrolase)